MLGVRTARTAASSRPSAKPVVPRIISGKLCWRASGAYFVSQGGNGRFLSDGRGKRGERGRKAVSGDKTEILQKEVRVSEIDTIIQYLYEDRAAGRITAECYETLSAKYETEQKNLKNELSNLKFKENDTEMKERFIQDFLDKARQYTDITAVTPEILHQFVRKIYAHEKQKIFSRMEGNLIEIEYTFERPKATQRRGKMVYGM